MGIFVDISTDVLKALKAAKSLTEVVVQVGTPLIATVMVLTVIWYALEVLEGSKRASLLGFFQPLIRPFFVYVFLILGYNDLVVPAFTGLKTIFFNAMANTQGLTSTPGTNMVFGVGETDITGTSVYQLMDDLVGQTFLNAQIAGQSFSAMKWYDFSWSILGSMISLWIYMLLVVLFCTMCVVYSLLLEFGFTVVFNVGAFFVLFLAFHQTMHFATSWISTVIKYIMTFAVLGFVIGLSYNIGNLAITHFNGQMIDPSVAPMSTLALLAVMVFLFFFIKMSAQVAADISGGMALAAGNLVASAATSILRYASAPAKVAAQTAKNVVTNKAAEKVGSSAAGGNRGAAAIVRLSQLKGRTGLTNPAMSRGFADRKTQLANKANSLSAGKK